MKLAFMIASFTFSSALTLAADLSGQLDLSQLYNHTNAGQYKAEVSLDLKDQVVATIVQGLNVEPGADQPGDAYRKVCTTEITVDAGTVTLTLIDQKTKQQKQLTQTLKFYTSDYAADQTCPNPNFILKQNIRYSAYVNFSESVLLAYPVPKGYDSLEATFSVFPFGYNVQLNATQLSQTDFVYSNIKQQLAPQLRHNNTDGLSYYVVAKNRTTTLSLGQGFIELK